jgi:UDP-N-acetylglucosamine acyltransferase
MTGNTIHPTAVVEPGVELGKDLEIGAYAVIRKGVRLGDRCRVEPHAVLQGETEIGPDNHFFSFTSIGGKSQDLKYQGEPTHLRIGARNVFREFVTVNRGTAPGAATVIGDDNLLLSYAHVAHDCRVGNHTIFSNNGTLAGHVEVGDHAVIGGLSAVHQFCRVGAHAMIGGCAKIVQDVPPYFIADGNPAQIRGVNVVGLQRRGFGEEQIKVLRQAYRVLYDKNLNTSQALEKLRAEIEPTPEIRALMEFASTSQRGIIR